MTKFAVTLMSLWSFIYPSDSYSLDQKNNPTLLWAWALNAPLTELNKLSHSIYGGEVMSASAQENYKKVLAQWWEVNDRDTAIQTINQLGNMQMGLPVFTQKMLPYFKMSKEELSQITTDDPVLKIALDNIDFLKVYGIKGWDLSRAQTVIAWSYFAGYLSAETAENFATALARRTQSQFPSWGDMAASYLIGYLFWSKDVEAFIERNEVVTHLLKSPSSPWVRLSWEAELLDSKGVSISQ